MPSILRRIKKKEFEGFKEFVQSLETTTHSRRVEIILAAILEDPVYMVYIIKNMLTVKEAVELMTDSIESFFQMNQNAPQVLAKAFYKEADMIVKLKTEILSDRMATRFMDECDLINKLTVAEKESSGYQIIQSCRALQESELIYGKPWSVPPNNVMAEDTVPKPDGPYVVTFENGNKAAEGEHLKSQREGLWIHYYENGIMMAKGNWKSGVKEGEWMFWHANGKKKADGVFQDDQKVGNWVEFDRNGEPTK